MDTQRDAEKMEQQLAGTKKLSNGSKARQRVDTENRARFFSDWLRERCIHAFDADFVIGSRWLEYTLCERGPITKQYLEAIDARRIDRQNDDKLVAREARLWGKKACLVVSDTTCKTFWLRPITGKREMWVSATAASLTRWLKKEKI